MGRHQWRGADRELTGGELLLMRLQALFGWALLSLLGLSWRVAEDAPKLAGIRRGSPSKGVIYVFWHNRLLPLTFTHRGRGIHALRSSSRDGQLIADILHRFGFGAPAGSSSREGAAGLRKLVRTAMKGDDVALTVDGPKGPRGRFKAGALQVAALSGNPIVPLTMSASGVHRLRNWDRTTIPQLFSRVRVSYGDPIYVPKRLGEKELEELRVSLETSLQILADNLDEAMGIAPIPPDMETDPNAGSNRKGGS